MSDIVNLNERRKRRDREQRKAEADAKRILFGRTKGDKQRTEKERSADIRKLDGAQRERPGREKDKERD
jgi:hypothetical protein